MSQSFQDDYAASLDPRVVAQVTAAIYAQAQNVYTETVTSQTPARKVFATKVVTGQQQLWPWPRSRRGAGA